MREQFLEQIFEKLSNCYFFFIELPKAYLPLETFSKIHSRNF